MRRMIAGLSGTGFLRALFCSPSRSGASTWFVAGVRSARVASSSSDAGLHRCLVLSMAMWVQKRLVVTALQFWRSPEKRGLAGALVTEPPGGDRQAIVRPWLF